ncbi:MAG: UDP-N-acetylglucosamine--N-acetylmuramyl-(pentapeptide) pyrophosphoryl-undecaprenol N-acetylglucosamine transferase, partial [Pseudomonadota bacterium]|nr:UDP-N-acetylglucosamine--N-acetylmuramyl-(pentapeptide) pyrophosphoryl-undecaprenol N-acetylglucosamine transferase [Pseudomonadota bacterium]
DAVKELADLVESFGGAELMDVIRVGQNNARGASQGVPVGQGAARDAAEEPAS